MYHWHKHLSFVGIVILTLIFAGSIFGTTLSINLNTTLRGSGLEIAEGSITVSDMVFTATVVTVDTTLRKVRVLSPISIEDRVALQSEFAGYNISEYRRLSGFSVAQSGGYLSSWQPPIPLGFRKFDGTVVNREHNSWLVDGIFCTDGTRFRIGFFKEVKSSDWLDCIQSGPVMVKGGKVILRETKRNRKLMRSNQSQSFVCETMQGKLLMVVTDKITLADLLKVLPGSGRSGFGCVNALRLSGSVTAGIEAKIGSKVTSVRLKIE